MLFFSTRRESISAVIFSFWAFRSATSSSSLVFFSTATSRSPSILAFSSACSSVGLIVARPWATQEP